MKYTLHPSKEGFIVTSDKLPKDQEGYWTYIGFNEPMIVTKCNQPTGWFEKLWDKHNYKTVIAQQDQINFSGLSEEKQKDIGYFDVDKLAKEWARNIVEPSVHTAFYISYKEGFKKAQELLSDRRFTKHEVLRLISDMSIELSINPPDSFDEIQRCGLNILQSLSQKSWDIEGEFIDNKFKITKIL